MGENNAGAKALADCVQINATVHTLDFAGNDIGAAGVAALWRAFDGCRRKSYERGLYYEMLLMISLCEQGTRGRRTSASKFRSRRRSRRRSDRELSVT